VNLLLFPGIFRGHSPRALRSNIYLKYMRTHDLFGVAGCIVYHGDSLSRVAHQSSWQLIHTSD